MKCVIPCGGSSTRLEQSRNKCLAEVGGKSVLAHIVDFWRDVGIEDFVFIIGGDSAEEMVSGIYKLGLRTFTFINRGKVVNLTGAIYLTRGHVGQRFVLALGDCLNIGTFSPQSIGDYGIGVCRTDEYELRKNYLVEIDGHRVSRVIEKPKESIGLCGMGTLFLSRKIFDYMEQLDFPPLATSVDLTGAVQLAINAGEDVVPVYFEGTYINLTCEKDLKKAEETLNANTS